MLNNKYRVHEVAKDFKKNSKEITDILTEYAKTPKNHMQVLEDGELSVIFDYLTQHNQVESVESIYADVYHEPKAQAKPAAQNAGHQGGQKPAQNQGQNQGQNQNRPQGGQPRQGGSAAARPAQGQGQRPAQSAAGKPASRIPEKKIVDTRKGGDVNLEKYDERLEDLAAGKTKQTVSYTHLAEKRKSVRKPAQERICTPGPVSSAQRRNQNHRRKACLTV